MTKARSSGLEGPQGYGRPVWGNAARLRPKAYTQTASARFWTRLRRFTAPFYLITVVGCCVERYERRKRGGKGRRGVGWGCLQDGSFSPLINIQMESCSWEEVCAVIEEEREGRMGRGRDGGAGRWILTPFHQMCLLLCLEPLSVWTVPLRCSAIRFQH